MAEKHTQLEIQRQTGKIHIIHISKLPFSFNETEIRVLLKSIGRLRTAENVVNAIEKYHRIPLTERPMVGCLHICTGAAQRRCGLAKSRRHGDLTRHSDFTRRGDRQQRVQPTGERTSHTEKSQHLKMYADTMAERLKNLKVNKCNEFLRRIAKYTRCHMNPGSLTIMLGASQSQKQLFEWPGIEKPTAKKQTLSQNSPHSENNGFSSSNTFKQRQPKKKAPTTFLT